MIRACALAIALLLPISGQAADAPKPVPATKSPAKKCDPNKIHTGPRGGKYHYTADCKKVYIKR